MRILFDSQIFTWQKFGGISKYHVELMKNLPAEGVEYTVDPVVSENVNLRELEAGKVCRSFPDFRGKRRLMTWINRMYDIILLRSGNYDLFHPTYYHPYFLKHIRKPYVITVHDMIHERFAEVMNDPTTIRYKKETILNANHIIAISEYTKRDLMELYGLEEHKISVVYHGIDADIMSHMQPVDNLPGKYILFTGQRGGYKNFLNFLDAVARVFGKYQDIHLVCTGRKFSEEELLEIDKRGLSSRITSLFVNQNQLSYLYHHALCFVFPSLYEGFGIPILESFAAKYPIALSDATCFPEIAGNAGVYFDPKDANDMADAILRLIENEDLRKEMVRLGEERVKLFTWQKAAAETAEVYRRVL